LLAVFCAGDTDDDRRSSWLLGIDTATGQDCWRAPLDAYLDLCQDVPVVGNGVVVTGSESDTVVARSMTDGSLSLVYATARAPR
jgi:outer membrane protein assembly factor BamB